jgi:predicted kinase
LTTSHSLRALFVCGVPASGKSTFARFLARELGWTLLDLDTLTNPLYEYFGGEARSLSEFGSGTRRSGTNAVRYRCLYDAAAENLMIGNEVVLVAPFTSERSSPHTWSDTIEHLGVSEGEALLIWMDLPRNEVIARMRRRSSDRDREKLSVIDDVLTPATLGRPVIAHLRVDGLSTPEAQFEGVMPRIRA